uniref:Uncharacterized protein n=1 Tax=Brassica campestris TaxID=3711 RepID=M4DN16_BRACM
MFVGSEPPGVFTGATRHQDIATLPPSCSYRRDEAVDTNHAAIELRTKPPEPPEVSPLRARELHAQPPEIVAAAHTAVLRCRTTAAPPSTAVLCRLSPLSSAVVRPLPSPPMTSAGDSSVTRPTRLSRLDLEFI